MKQKLQNYLELNTRSFRAAWPGWQNIIWQQLFSAAGGLGLIGAASAPADWVRQQVREVKKLTDKPFGVNIS